jgi:hypothetical protein
MAKRTTKKKVAGIPKDDLATVAGGRGGGGGRAGGALAKSIGKAVAKEAGGMARDTAVNAAGQWIANKLY